MKLEHEQKRLVQIVIKLVGQGCDYKEIKLICDKMIESGYGCVFYPDGTIGFQKY